MRLRLQAEERAKNAGKKPQTAPAGDGGLDDDGRGLPAGNTFRILDYEGLPGFSDMIYLNEMAVRSASRDSARAGFPNALSDCATDKG